VPLKSQKQLRYLQQNNPALAEKLSAEVDVNALPEQAAPQPKPKQPPRLFRTPKSRLFKM
jgi:hypothetical protein